MIFAIKLYVLPKKVDYFFFRGVRSLYYSIIEKQLIEYIGSIVHYKQTDAYISNSEI